MLQQQTTEKLDEDKNEKKLPAWIYGYFKQREDSDITPLHSHHALFVLY